MTLIVQFYQIGTTPTFKNITCNDVRKTNKKSAFVTFSPGCSKCSFTSATSSKAEIEATNKKHTSDSATLTQVTYEVNTSKKLQNFYLYFVAIW